MKTDSLFPTIEKSARFSPCRQYRYTLHRLWDIQRPYLMTLCLNPSTADETKADPTVRRCIRFAHDWGYGGLAMTNIFAYRATLPTIMMNQVNPVGPENNRWLLKVARGAGRILVAWGFNGAFRGRHLEIKDLLRNFELHCFGLTKNGQPRHPLYLRREAGVERWK